MSIQVVDAPHLLATKLVAWHDRGGSSWASHDWEDIVRLIDGRPELSKEIAGAPAPLRSFLADELAALLADADLEDLLAGSLGSDEASQGRVGLLIQRLRGGLEAARNPTF